MLSHEKYTKTINAEKITELTTFASSLATKLIKNGKRGDAPIIEEIDMREIY